MLRGVEGRSPRRKFGLSTLSAAACPATNQSIICIICIVASERLTFSPPPSLFFLLSRLSPLPFPSLPPLCSLPIPLCSLGLVSPRRPRDPMPGPGSGRFDPGLGSLSPRRRRGSCHAHALGTATRALTQPGSRSTESPRAKRGEKIDLLLRGHEDCGAMRFLQGQSSPKAGNH